jgi:hypothetical protein
LLAQYIAGAATLVWSKDRVVHAAGIGWRDMSGNELDADAWMARLATLPLLGLEVYDAIEDFQQLASTL